MGPPLPRLRKTGKDELIMHVMMDMETFGTRAGCALRSLGAVAFDPRGNGINSKFYANISLASCLQAGLTVDANTLAWWDEQSAEARAGLYRPSPQPLDKVAGEFHTWFVQQQGDVIWSHGANFDEPLWQSAAAAVGRAPPWKFWNVRCTRTLFAAAKFDPHGLPRLGTHHNALDDAIFQVGCVQVAMKNIP